MIRVPPLTLAGDPRKLQRNNCEYPTNFSGLTPRETPLIRRDSYSFATAVTGFLKLLTCLFCSYWLDYCLLAPSFTNRLEPQISA